MKVLTDQEVQQLLAALRYWQSDSGPDMESAKEMDHFEDGSVEPMTDEAIDELCESINLDAVLIGQHEANIVVEVEDGQFSAYSDVPSLQVFVAERDPYSEENLDVSRQFLVSPLSEVPEDIMKELDGFGSSRAKVLVELLRQTKGETRSGQKAETK